MHSDYFPSQSDFMSRLHRLCLCSALGCGAFFTATVAQADRTVTDQLGRQVILLDHVSRVVVLQHQTLNLLVQLNAQEDIVGVLNSWQKQLGPQFARFMPNITTLPMPGDLTQANIESLLALHPQVVKEIETDPQWQAIDAVKNHRVWLMPEYAKA
jgi:iron complex transport system substrate-binding protein